jgi:hypothetical protein
VLLAALMLLIACAAGPSNAPAVGTTSDDGYTFPPAPAASGGAVGPEVDEALRRLAPSILTGALDQEAVEVVATSEDARLAWFVSDLLRFLQGGAPLPVLVDTFERLTGVDPRDDPTFLRSPWQSVTNHLIAWDLPAQPGYEEMKADLFLRVEPGWEPFFADADSDIDWRLVSWGGVFIDDRPLGGLRPCSRGCIPALDDPPLIGADAANWYPDDGYVFGVVVGDDAVAFPKNMMEVHEMVNITIGSRRLGIPYCTLCGSAQAYFTDSVPDGVDTPVLRTSGLLSRSNKVMYDLLTRSVFDTFTGEALSGPLQGVVLEQTTVVTSTWGEWKRAHPSTRIVAQDGGIGRFYPADPLQGRDAAGPIFPVGDVDPRLRVQAQVLGVIAPDGTPVAFPVELARTAVASGEQVEIQGVELVADGGGLRARVPGGIDLTAHQAFWFAWSQFHPDTLLWEP